MAYLARAVYGASVAGMVSTAAFRSVVTSFADNLSNEEIVEMTEEADTNGDGGKKMA